jgi:hypothetical protein
MTDDIICRFCLMNDVEKENPFLSPCNCIGTLRYVHRQCLDNWRNLTTVPDNRRLCQLCLTPYRLPRRWPYEHRPSSNIAWRVFLGHPFFVTICAHYFHFCIISNLRGFDLFLISLSHPNVTFYFNIVLLSIASIFATYYYYLLNAIINKKLYLKFSCVNYLKLLGLSAVTFYLTQHSIFPFGGLFIYTLTQYKTIHIQTIEDLNYFGMG